MVLTLKLVVAVVLAFWFFRQIRKSSGWLGRRVVNAMNLAHTTLTAWGLQQLTALKTAKVLDIGCGVGATVQRLAALASDGMVVGLDYSVASVEVSRVTNATEIQAGRVQIEQGSVEALPFPEGTFDTVTAVESHYYWPDLPTYVREILRVLNPGGTFA